MLKQLVYRLRQKIEADPSQPRYVQSVAGAGYTFEA
jgi:DNA-binding response OmpR family regulator